jgi:class 3 adenylate cyclase
VTVLFADVPGFTALFEQIDAEDVGDTLNKLWRRLGVHRMTWRKGSGG